MKYNFDKPINRYGTGSVKYEALYEGKPLGDDALPMWVADMDFECAPAIIDAAKRTADTGIFGYTDLKLMPEYYRAVCDYYKRRFDWHIDSESILVSPGVVPGIELCIQALTRQGDGVIIQRPVYYPFARSIEKLGRRVISNPLLEQQGVYAIDFDDLEKKAASKTTTMMILCSPHNPVGRVWTKDELARIHAICKQNDVLIVSDEIHCDLTRVGVEHTVLASMLPNDRTIITCTAPSKTFNIAGLARSHIIVPDKQLREKIAPLTSTSTDPITARMVQAAFNECDDWLLAVREYIDENFAFLKQYLKQKLPRAAIADPQGTYLAWVDVRAYAKDTKKLERDLVRYRGVYVEAGETFGSEGAGFLRVNVGCPTRNIRAFVDALAAMLDHLKKGDRMLDFSLSSAWGGRYTVASDGKKKLIIFLRHIGCPFTQLYLARLAACYTQLMDNGIKIIVVTQNTVPSLESRLNRKAVPFYLLADPDGAVFAQYKVHDAQNRARLVGEDDAGDLRTISETGVKEGPAEGDELILPAIFAVNTLDKFEFVHYGNTAGDMPNPKKLLAAFNKGGLVK